MLQPKIIEAERIAAFHLPAGYAASLLSNIKSARGASTTTSWCFWMQSRTYVFSQLPNGTAFLVAKAKTNHFSEFLTKIVT